MRKDIVISLILVILWMVFLFYLSSKDTISSNQDSSNIVKGIVDTVDNITGTTNEKRIIHNENNYLKDINTIFRKVCHSICYMTLSILVFNFIIRITKNKILIYDLISFIICFIYACTDEYHQSFVTGRTGSFNDVLIDSSGIIIGLLLISLIYKKYDKRLHYV